MKVQLLSLFFFVCLSVGFSQNSLENIEQKILQAHGKSFATEQDQFEPIIEKLEASYEKSQDNSTNYWLCFALYRQSIFYLSTDRDAQSSKILKKSIDRMKGLKNPTSEDLALHGSMLSLSINFQPEMAALLSGEAASLYDKAIKLNENNLRANLGIGKSDFYKPVEYGGGFKVESYLKKTIGMPDKSSAEANAPSWGKNEAYYYLASYYQREGRTGEAKLYCNKGLKAYPNYRLLQSLQAKLQ